MPHTLKSEKREVLVCSVCHEVICVHCYVDENGDVVDTSECQGHIGNLVDGCDHGGDE